MAKPRVLVADDHAETRGLLATLLGSEFDVVATVADGRAAVAATAALQPDVVVLDIAMPFDPLKRIGQGDLVMLDARELLSRFMDGDVPETQRFEDTIGPIMDAAAGSGERKVRAYGEMVDVLCNDGNAAAAVSLEML